MRKFAAIALACCLSAELYADQSEVNVLPPYIAPHVMAEAPVGKAHLSWFGFSVYDIALWSAKPEWSYDTAFALQVRYARTFSAEQLIDSTMDEISKVAQVSEEEAPAYHAALKGLMPGVQEGDTITALYLPRKGLVMFHNGVETGRSKDMAFARRFTDIWLSPDTSHPDIRNALIGASVE